MRVIHTQPNYTALRELKRCERVYAYYMSRAINAGERIVIQQYDRDGLAIREFIENIMDVAPSLGGFQDYYREVCANQGVFRVRHDHEWIQPTFTRRDLEQICEENGIVAALIIDRIFTSAKFADVCQYGTSTDRWSIDDQSYAQFFASELTEIIGWFDKARVVADEYPQYWSFLHTMGLQELIDFLKDPTEITHTSYMQTWASTIDRTDYSLDWMISYDDPLGKHDTFAADLTIEARSLTKYSENILAVEHMLPVPEQSQRTSAPEPTIAIRYRVAGTGAFGPLYQVMGYSHPDTETGAESREITYMDSLPIPDHRFAFIADPSDQKTIGNHLSELDTILTVLHESGHSFGVPSNPIDNYLTTTFGNTHGDALDELRAELTCWYLGTHSDINQFEIWGDWKDDERIRAIDVYMTDVAPHKWLRHGADTEDAHTLADTAIFRYLLHHGAISIDSDPHFMVSVDSDLVREHIETFLKHIYDIYYRGDKEACETLFETYGHPPADYVDAVRAHISSDSPDLVQIFPKIIPIYDEEKLEECQITRFTDDIAMHRWNWNLHPV